KPLLVSDTVRVFGMTPSTARVDGYERHDAGYGRRGFRFGYSDRTFGRFESHCSTTDRQSKTSLRVAGVPEAPRSTEDTRGLARTRLSAPTRPQRSSRPVGADLARRRRNERARAGAARKQHGRSDQRRSHRGPGHLAPFGMARA